jgi:Flp pilus assembly pilin Flp
VVSSGKHDDRGATAVEYAMLAALIAAGLILIFQGIGEAMNLAFDNSVDGMSG